MEYTHKIKHLGYNQIVTIVRDPVESITSWVSMELHYQDLDPTRQNQNIHFYIDDAVRKYIMFYSYALKHVDIFFNYIGINDKVNDYIDYLSDTLGIEKLTDEYEDLIYDEIDNRHIVTSKNSKYYDAILFAVGRTDLSRCEDLYQQALSRCVAL
jgi:hypothetical protein